MRVFSTYHPAHLLRKPAVGSAVEAHLRLLDRALDGLEAYDLDLTKLDIVLNPPVPKYPLSIVSLDIETYGILDNMPLQRFWQPPKSVRYDGIRPEDLVQTVGISWRDPEGALHNGIFHRLASWDVLWSWLRRIRTDGSTLLCQNGSFDLSYLRYGCPVSRAWLRAPMVLADLSVTNYLYSEVRPERSLKNISPLLGTTKYEGGFIRYDSVENPALWTYNCQDSAATLINNEKIWTDIRGYYGGESPKLSAFNKRWYSDLLWLVLSMSEHGVCMDRPSLEELNKRYATRVKRLVSYAKTRWDMPLKGDGSDTAKRDAIELGSAALPQGKTVQLILTKKTKKLSFKDENRNMLLGVLDRRCDAAQRLRVMGRYADCAKMMDSYLRPLLVGRGHKADDYTTCLIDGIVYPRWHPVPSQFDDGKSGGTVQSRVVCSAPGVQTFPALIKHRISCRFPGGVLLWFDLSQIELRVAALLSGDPIMLAEYLRGIDRHSETAKMIFSPGIVTHHQFKSLYRQAGKTLNFLVLFRGGAKKFQETLTRDIGLYIALAECKDAIDRMRMKYPHLWQWQDGLIAEAKVHGFLELPLIGQSRLYLGGHAKVEEAMNEIVNQPVQTTAANIMLSIQTALLVEFARLGLRSIVPLNIYDAAPVEVYPGELASVLAVMDRVIPSPPYFQELCRHLGRTVPITYEWHLEDR